MRKKSRSTEYGGIEMAPLSRLSNNERRMRRLMFRLLLIVSVLFIVYAVFDSNSGFIQIYKLKKAQNELIATNHRLLVKLMNAEITKRRLQDDIGYLEYIARSKYNMSLPGEVIYRITE